MAPSDHLYHKFRITDAPSWFRRGVEDRLRPAATASMTRVGMQITMGGDGEEIVALLSARLFIW
jgi:hypothetical protein